MQGRVLQSTGSWYQVLLNDRSTIECRLKGKIRLKGVKSTNPVAVGDLVTIEHDDTSEDYQITDVLERNNYFIRQSPKKRTVKHIVAANIDKAFLVATVTNPEIRLGFIDRFLLTAEVYHIPVCIVFNKSDLYEPKDIERYVYLEGLYTKLGYETILVSAEKGTAIEELKAMMKDGINLLAGQSGVGKSSLINAINGQLHLRTNKLSNYHGKGQHTTTFATMFPLSFGGFIIDTPGFKTLGIVDISKYEIAEYFPEMRSRLADCKFNNCLHLNEPKCAVKEAVENGEIEESRYANYFYIYEDLKNTKLWDQ